MKRKLSITVDEDTAAAILSRVEQGRYRNVSHFIEYASNELLKEDTNA